MSGIGRLWELVVDWELAVDDVVPDPQSGEPILVSAILFDPDNDAVFD